MAALSAAAGALSLLISTLELACLPGGAAAADEASETGIKRGRMWTEEGLTKALGDLQDEVAKLHTELAWLRQENAGLRESLNNSDDSRSGGSNATKMQGPPRDPNAEHGSTLFLAMCAGSVYFDTYCGPFLASFERAYGASASRHRVVAFTADVDERLRDAAEKRFSPWARIEVLQKAQMSLKGGSEQIYGKQAESQSENMACSMDGNRIKHCEMFKEALDSRDFRTMLDSLMFPWRITQYLKEHADGFCYAAIMDSDMLFVQPLGQYLPKCETGGGADWDVAFTVYDHKFKVPWADDPAAAGRTQHGLSRVNCGLVLLNLHDVTLAKRFLSKWVHVTHDMLTAGVGGDAEDYDQWRHWEEQLGKEFRGNDQAGLVLLLSGYDTTRLHSLLGWGPGACEVCETPVEVRLDAFQDEKPLPVRFRAFPARVLNHPEAMEGGAFSEDLRIVHLKGLWWRLYLSKGMLTWDATRRPEWHAEAMALQGLSRMIWQMAVPEEARRIGP